MTDTELEAGRELDARVAKEVMGWRIERYMTNPPKVTGMAMGPGPDREIREIPHYSTDIAAAWQVMEKVSGDWHVEISGGGDIVSVRFDDFYEIVVNVWANTAPLAICRAALKALGVSLPSSGLAAREKEE